MKLIDEREKAINRTWDFAIGNRIREKGQPDLITERRFVFKPQFADFIIV